MQEAGYYKKLKQGVVQCQLCPHFCTVKNNETGRCRIRKNIEGKLYSLVFGSPGAVNIDPIEKKPLYHFLPGSRSLSIGTAGCNLSCMHCQNFDLSQNSVEDHSKIDLPPKEVILHAQENDVRSISYTYNEPTIFIEYLLKTAALAKKHDLKNVIVSNGFINPGPLEDICELIDAANIDLKAFTEEFYDEICGASLAPVLKTIKTLFKRKVWLELTMLLIPGKNDSPEEIEKACMWIKENLSDTVPIHFSRFMPMFRMQDIGPTPKKTLLAAEKIAKKHLKYVYIGNMQTKSGTDTRCPDCQALLIKRDYYTTEMHIQGNTCRCGRAFDGIIR
jgi:pyruvate formate lyase activating enzyme